MVSEAYRQLEDSIGTNHTIHDEIVESIIYKLKKDKALLERAIYLTCVTVGTRPVETAHIVNEFLIHLDEQENTKETQ